MIIGGFQKFSLIDYPGKISATVFTQGCNFLCPYCHNPELVDPGQYGPAIPEDKVLHFLNERRGKLEAVTVTGGEPTIQRNLMPFLETIKDMGYLIKVDTNGAKPEVLETLISKRLVDYLAMDIKGPLQRYRQIASVPVDIAKIIDSIEIITGSGIDHEFRTTVVKSQIAVPDLIAIARLVNISSLYILQPFIPTKTLNGSFLSESSYSRSEFTVILEILTKEGARVVFR